MWLRHQGKGNRLATTLELTRQLPLKFVKTAIHSHEKQQPHLKLATGYSSYLMLCPLQMQEIFLLAGKTLFTPQDHQWRLIAVCRPSWLRAQWTYLCLRQSLVAVELHGEGDHSHVGIRSLPMVSEVTSSPYAEGEGIQHVLCA
ncbi:hypothetical protein HPG69_009429 [Diceros bicornis minor]|uniref:Golgi associated RAB2 interactor protein-like Rab2B-binding domain-containing protein n=1 Tax=Diceros bicornis minor TaxID=77932 RepID=A0A7J7F2W6_DICBM|nr:hypothetical protein HPG69_009429 [Diceros bicornis minor]